MFRHKLSAFDKEIITIHPGEYHATGEDIIIATVLGSCIAVSLFDRRLAIGGLNHFMLPGVLDDEDISRSGSGKYGMYAMELLYNEMLKQGCRRGDLGAKVFGGASVLNLPGGGSKKIPEDNIAFAFSYLEKEGIPVQASDVGGLRARKLFFFARSGKVRLKRFGGQAVTKLEHEEEAYLKGIRRMTEGPIVLFGDASDRPDR